MPLHNFSATFAEYATRVSTPPCEPKKLDVFIGSQVVTTNSNCVDGNERVFVGFLNSFHVHFDPGLHISMEIHVHE